MKNKKRILTALLAVVLCMAAFPLTAFAGGGEETEPPTEATSEPTTEPEQPANPNPVALTPDGNLTLVDDIDGEQAEDKQFLTVITKGGNYFYIVIDRAGDKENVHFLNMVDEADLLALIEDMDTVPAQPVITPEPQPDPEPALTAPEPEPEKKGGAGGILLIVLMLAAGGGAFYYFKVLKPKQAVQGGTDLSELDELDFDGDNDDFMSMGVDEQEQEDGEK
ncbi:DUF4366 domain-containing protein [Anaeropeptidivorans aminofermentans]|jgi:hypothetical protein|uniref:DUF4366 domain-containing protein n=1 Tax=Anaeropeptidivorans aminofermentans TaxID=2934315 RepID=UPI002024B21E|nr:DUF4366 domain-containing protein [Anaeropeptidivorans aminofermentans]